MTTPHKHAALIKAWADGAEIEFRSPCDLGKWLRTSSPEWSLHNDYRVKPHKWQKEMDAFVRGEDIEVMNIHVRNWATFSNTSPPNWDSTEVVWRIKPVSYNEIYWKAYGGGSSAEGIEAVLVEFCKRNNLNRDAMK